MLSQLSAAQTKKTKSGLSEQYRFILQPNEPAVFTKLITTITSREARTNPKALQMIEQKHDEGPSVGFEGFLRENETFYAGLLAKSDIEIEGNNEDLQGIRYCSFMLNSTYHGYNEMNNLGAKGLTGEAYSGHAFWDSETYCLPFFFLTTLKRQEI